MRLEALLRAHGFMRTEQPPELWAAQTEDIDFIPLLGELIVVLLSRGAELSDCTLAAANVVVEANEDEGSGPPVGEHVAITVRGSADVGGDGVWLPEKGSGFDVLAALDGRLKAAGARYAYVRRMPPESSVTVFLAREI